MSLLGVALEGPLGRAELLARYVELVAARCRPNTVLATVSDLKVFFAVIDKDPAAVMPADVSSSSLCSDAAVVMVGSPTLSRLRRPAYGDLLSKSRTDFWSHPATYGWGMADAPLRVMLDSNAFDALALDDQMRSDVGAAVATGALDLVVTHVQMDELDATSDPRRAALRRLTVSATYTSGFVPGVSRLGMAALSTDAEAAIFHAVTGGNPRHNEDALILLTARRERIPVVTIDERLLKHCATQGVETMSPADLLLRLGSTR